jgi:hypothetical protein
VTFISFRLFYVVSMAMSLDDKVFPEKMEVSKASPLKRTYQRKLMKSMIEETTYKILLIIKIV